MKNYLIIEGEGKATVDFLDEGVSVQVFILNGKVEILAQMSHGPDASTFDVRQVSWELPEKR